MDCRFKTSFIVLAIAASGLAPALATAQDYYYSDSRSYGGDYEQPRAQRNQELPKGLTLVPWKIERRTSLEEIRASASSGSDATRRAGRVPNPPPANQ